MGFKFFANVLVLTFFFAPSVTYSGSSADEAAMEQFLLKYNEQDYGAAKAIVDRFYQKHDAVWSLYAAALYKKEGRCSDALKAIEYVKGYYDADHGKFMELSKNKESPLFGIYLDLKKIGVECNMELGNWAGFINDATTYLELSEDPNSEEIVMMLGYAHMQIAMNNASSAILNYSKVVRDVNDASLHESALFNLTHLYFMTGQVERSISSAEDLFKIAKKKEQWVGEMESIPGLNEQVLKSWRVKRVLEGK